jgi:hypothetical protein
VGSETGSTRSEDQTQFVALASCSLYYIHVTVDLNICRARIPLSLHGSVRSNILKFSDHVLTFGQFPDSLIVHEDLESLAVDSKGTKDFRGLDVDLPSDFVDQVSDRSLHKIDGSIVIVLGNNSGNPGLYVDTRY